MSESLVNSNVESAAPATVEEVSAQEAAEKMLPQSKVNEIVGAEKNRGYQRGYQAALEELKAKQQEEQAAQATQDAQRPVNPAENATDIRSMLAEEMKKLKEEQEQEMLQKQQEQQMNQLRSELEGKISDAQNRYDDFDNITSQVDFTEIPEVLIYANTVDNAGDVLYDLANNVHKIGQIRGLPASAAVQYVKKLSDSIKQNQQASQAKQPNAPLDRLTPSNVGGSDSPLSLRDLKKRYRV